MPDSTATDDRLLCGDPPASIEASLLETVDDVDLRDTVTLFFRPFRPYTYHCASLARALSDNVTGSESIPTDYMTSLAHFSCILQLSLANSLLMSFSSRSI